MIAFREEKTLLNKMDDYFGQQKKTRRSKKMRMDDTAIKDEAAGVDEVAFDMVCC